MLSSGWQIVLDAYEKYTAGGVMQMLCIATILIIIIKEKDKYLKHLAFYIIALVAIIAIPPIAFVLAEYFIGYDVYWRIFWLVPSVIIVAFGGTRIIEQMNRKAGKRIVFFALLLVIAIGGRSVYRTENFTKSVNLYKLPQEAIDICEMVAPNGGSTKMVVPETIVSYIRQYNSNIKLLYGRNMGKDIQKGKKYKVLLQLNSSEPDYKYIADYCKSNKCEYVVFENSATNMEDMTNYGYELFASTQNYTIFKRIE